MSVTMLINGLVVILMMSSVKAGPGCSAGVCENVKKYPLNQIQAAVMNNLDKYQAFFGNEIVENTITTPSMETTNRGAFAFESAVPSYNFTSEERFCESYPMLKHPKYGETIDREWYFIVNDGRNFTQGIRVEMCLEPNTRCKHTDSMSNGYETKCVQAYTYRYLLALKDGEIFKGAFRMPSYCKCSIIKNLRY